MHPTRRLWAVVALAGFLAVLAVVTARPLLLVGVGLLGAWVVTQQYRFLRTLDTTVDALQVHQSPARSGIQSGETVPVTLTATLGTASPLALEIKSDLPTAAVADEPLELSLAPIAASADRTVEVSWPVTGRHRFDQPTVTATNAFFRETIPLGNAPTVTVDARGPRTIHVGEGGDRLAAAYGAHESGRRGSGIEPAGLREYTPGDRLDRIDWKATARLSTPHIREYEAETDRRTMLVVDHRASLATGTRGETKLDYLRDVALAITASARRLGDPIGVLGVGNDGITTRIEPATTPATYTRIRDRLLTLDPTVPAAGSSDASALATRPTTTAAARRKFEALTTDTGAFAATLRPFYETRNGYRRRLESDPLYGAVKTAQHREPATTWTIICTDDTHPRELHETIKYARRTDTTVLVLLAPTVLYEPDGLADLDQAYDRYVEFEEFRRELARLSGVTALEVGPNDRLATVLAAHRPRGGRA